MSRVHTTTDKDEAAHRRAIYSTLEDLISPGFVAQSVSVGGVEMSMRSMFPGEYTILRYRLGTESGERAWMEWAIASSVWILDGQILLGDPNAAVRIRRVLKSMPKAAITKLFAVYTEIQNRVRHEVERLEAFCYEDYSRMLWRMFGRGSPAMESAAGIPNVSSLGMNHIQRMWVAYNLAEDDRLAWQQEWAAAKLVASTQAPKGIKQLNQREESERKLEEERRRKVIEKAYYEVTGRMVGEESGMVVHRSVTPEELVDEMNRWVRGEKDWHDQVIDAYKERIRQKHEDDRQRHESRMTELEELQTEMSAMGNSSLVAYTAEQMRNIRGEEPARRAVVSEGGDTSRLFNKFVAQEIKAGGVGAGGKAIPIPQEMVRGDSDGTLQNQVVQRRVKFSDDGGA